MSVTPNIPIPLPVTNVSGSTGLAVSDSTTPSITELLQVLINEVRALRRAFVLKAVADGGMIQEIDCDPEVINAEQVNN